MTGKSRANLYYRLMDICLVLTLLMIINDAVEMFLAISTQSWDGSDGHLSTALTLLGLLSFILERFDAEHNHIVPGKHGKHPSTDDSAHDPF